MKLIEGKYAAAKVFTDNIEESASQQILALCNQSFVDGCKIRIMPDVHAGTGCVIGFTADLGNKIIPSIVGVDIGCLDKDTEILTPRGWVKISEYCGDKILVYDKLTDKAFFDLPYAYIKTPCDKFYHFHTLKGLDQMLSPEHKMLLWCGHNQKGYQQEIGLAEEIVHKLRGLKKADNYHVKATFSYEGSSIDISDTMIRILVMISADGRVHYNENTNKTYVEMHFKKERKVSRCKQLLESEKLSFKSSVGKDGSTYIWFTLNGEISKSLCMFYGASKNQLAVVIDEIYRWDGTIDEKRNHKSYCSVVKGNADVVQFALAANGIRCGISKIVPKNPKHSPVYVTYETKNEYVGLIPNIDEVQSVDGYKYCFTTSTGFFIIRRNNCISITGNCGMLVAELGKNYIDLKKLDDVIHARIPAGMAVHEKPTLEENFLYNLTCKDFLHNIDWIIRSLGTLGGGNHFIELDEDDGDNQYLVIHTGSRNLGKQVAEYYQNVAISNLKGKNKKKEAVDALINQLKAEGREKEISQKLSELDFKFPDIPNELCYLEGKDREAYLHDMKICQNFATMNRLHIMNEILNGVGLQEKIPEIHFFQTVHNYIDMSDNIIRKGSVSAKKGERLIIPLNMKDGSLICIGKGNPDWNCSAPHGAGRMYSRAAAKKAFSIDEFKKQMDGIYSTSVNEDTLDECPMAYKPSQEIIDAISPTVEIINHIKPVYNFKAGE